LRRIELQSAQPGQRLGRAILDLNGDVLLREGVELTASFIESLKRKGFSSLVIDDDLTRGIEVPEIVPQTVRRQAIAKVAAAFDAAGAVAREFRSASPEVVWDRMSRRSTVAGIGSLNFERDLLPVAATLIENVLTPPTLDGLNAVLMHDPASFEHSVNVCVIAIKIGQLLSLSVNRLRQLALGCLLHDIGKVFVPREILTKRGRLSPAERLQVQSHTYLGYRLLRATVTTDLLAHHVAWQHHERQDGLGYPRGLKGSNRASRSSVDRFRHDRILLLAEIAAVADFHDALTGARPQRPAYPCETVPPMLSEAAGPALNREIVTKLLTVLPWFPTGTEVVFTAGPHEGRRGVVSLADPAHLRRPKVRVLEGATGNLPADVVEIDLTEDRGSEVMSVQRARLERALSPKLRLERTGS